MEPKEFIDELNKVQDLMSQEKYSEAIILLENLKGIEKRESFNYNLTHKLYQLDSNARSLSNQQKILNLISRISQEQTSISFTEVLEKLKEVESIALDEKILRREIEILILRNLVSCKIEGNKLIF
ncbi:MAG: hypothetical protein ACFFDX_04290 [Candidatus Odinarchaeota archaeon]